MDKRQYPPLPSEQPRSAQEQAALNIARKQGIADANKAVDKFAKDLDRIK